MYVLCFLEVDGFDLGVAGFLLLFAVDAQRLVVFGLYLGASVSVVAADRRLAQSLQLDLRLALLHHLRQPQRALPHNTTQLIIRCTPLAPPAPVIMSWVRVMVRV